MASFAGSRNKPACFTTRLVYAPLGAGALQAPVAVTAASSIKASTTVADVACKRGCST
jgi:hypothetical protein